MNAETTYPELFQLFACYFNQDYDVMVDNFDRSKPIVPQLVQGYKEGSSKRNINKAIKELDSLVDKHYTNDVLYHLSSELGNDIDIEKFGYTYQQFFIEVRRLLRQ